MFLYRSQCSQQHNDPGPIFPSVTEAGSGVVSEQRNRLVATIKFIYAGIQKKDDCKQNPEWNESLT